MRTACLPVPPTLSSRRVRLRPPSGSDLPALYEIAASDDVFWRWRFGGALPTYEVFCASFAAGVLTQFAVCAPGDGRVLRLVVAYNADLGNRTAYFATVMRASTHGTGIGLEASALFLDYLFKTWDLHKLYLEVLEFNLGQFAHGVDRYFRREAHFTEHHYYDGRRWDQFVFAIYRDDILRDAVFCRLLARARAGMEGIPGQPRSPFPEAPSPAPETNRRASSVNQSRSTGL